MEPITLCGAVILAVGLWVEFESIIMKTLGAITGSSLMAAIRSSTTEQTPLHVKCTTGIGR